MDLELITKAVGLAGASVSSVSAAADLAARIKGMFVGGQPPAEGEVKSLIGELMAQIGAAQAANATLQIELAQLRLAMQKEDAARAKLGRYALRKTEGGDIVYVLREDQRGDEPDHFACPRCFEDGVRSILQTFGFSKTALACNACNGTYRIKPDSGMRGQGF